MAIDPERQIPGDPLTVQDQWLDANLRHQIGLLAVAGSIRNRIWNLLDATETDVRRAISDRLSTVTGLETPRNVQRLQALADELAEIRAVPWKDVRTLWRKSMTEIAVQEPQFMSALLKQVVPVRLSPRIPPAEELRTLVTAVPFQGRTLRQWADNVQRADIQRMTSQINIGIVQNETIPEISRRVVGTVRLNGRNGVTEITRRNAEAITRTATNHFANQSRQRFAMANADIVSVEFFVATLDSRTTPICRSLDGEQYPIGEGEIPPLHFSCRSLRMLLLDPEPISRRPMKPVTERGLLREYSAQQGFATVPKRRADLPLGQKGKFDAFARRRTRELIGTVPAKVTYQQFLARQTVAFQDDVLGPTRGRLFRRGGLTLDQFVEPSGRQRTLKDLAQLHADSFAAAGLDADAFLSRSR